MPLAESYAFLDCTFCGGQEPECRYCQGTGRIELFRCPNQLATRRELDAVSAVLLVEQGVLPDPGGWQDQAETFVRAYPLLAKEIAGWRAVHQRVAQQKAKAK